MRKLTQTHQHRPPHLGTRRVLLLRRVRRVGRLAHHR
jgi:hypothetical protein